jgi:hypothetical protein
LIGLASFVYWHTLRHDLTTGDVVVALVAALVGPITFIIGWNVYGKERVLIAKRKT